MDYQITAKPADEVIKEEGDAATNNIDNSSKLAEGMVSDSSDNAEQKLFAHVSQEEDENLHHEASSGLIAQVSGQEELEVSSENEASMAKENDSVKLEIPVGDDTNKKDIHTENIRENINPQEIKEEEKENKTEAEDDVNKLAPSSDRHNLFRRRPEIKVEQNVSEMVKDRGNITNNFNQMNQAMLKVQENDLIQTDLIRTNVYYTRKLYEEISDLKRTIKLQSYMRMATTLIFMAMTLVSLYYGYKMFSGIMQGGFSDIINSIPNLDMLKGGGDGNLSGNLLGGLMKMISGTGVEGGSPTSVESANLNLGALQNVVNSFLK